MMNSSSCLSKNRFYVVAHRGNSSVAPENTVASFDSAESAGVDFIETDLRLSRDGTVVLLHDASLDRTTNASGMLADRDACALQSLDAGAWFSPAFTGEKLPTLKNLLDWAVLRTTMHWLLELKGEWTLAALHAMAAALRRTGVSERVIIQTFDAKLLITLSVVAPDLERALLISEVTNGSELLRLLDTAGATACNPAVRLFHERPEVIALLQAEGQFVLPWTVNDPATRTLLREAGANGIITDTP